MNVAISIGIGLLIGAFVTFGSAIILKKAMEAMRVKVEAKNMTWSLAQATGLAGLWTSKLFLVGLALYFSIRAGYSAVFIGSFIPVGIVCAVFIIRRFSSAEKPEKSA